MILLDTNVVSEPMRLLPNSNVRAWFGSHSGYDLFLPAVGLAELLVGLAKLPDGKRRDGMLEKAWAFINETFQQRILPFDAAAASAYAGLVAGAARTGRTVSIGDGQIAAIAAVHGFAVATRDTAPFIAMGLPVIDPWQHPASSHPA